MGNEGEMAKRYTVTVRVMLAEVGDDGVTPAYYRDETIDLSGALDDLALILNGNSTNNTIRQMAQRLIAAERRGEWTE